jgi:hypothetical protein
MVFTFSAKKTLPDYVGYQASEHCPWKKPYGHQHTQAIIDNQSNKNNNIGTVQMH